MQTEGKRDHKFSLLLVHRPPKCLQQPVLGQSEAQTPSSSCAPTRTGVPFLSHGLRPSLWLCSRRKLDQEAEAQGLEAGVLMWGWQCSMQQLNHCTKRFLLLFNFSSQFPGLCWQWCVSETIGVERDNLNLIFATFLSCSAWCNSSTYFSVLFSTYGV